MTIDANDLERMAEEQPDDYFLKGSGVLKLLGAIRTLEAEVAALKAQPAPTEAAQGESPFKFRLWSKEAEMVESWTAAEKALEAAQGAQLSGNSGELAQGEDSARLDDLATIRGLDKIGMEFAARLTRVDTTTIKGRDYLERDDVMFAVINWRNEWDKNSKARKPIDRARASAETGGVKS